MKTNLEVRVGLFSFVAIVLLIIAQLWLKSVSIFHQPQRFIVEFHDVEGLHNAAPVNINGVRVGDVEKIELKGKGKVLVSLRISYDGITIPKGSMITIQTLGLVGAKYVEITLPESTGVQAVDIEPNTIVKGQDPVRAELIFNQIATELGSFTNIFTSQENKDHLVATLKNSSEAIRNINELTKKLNNDFKNFDTTINTVNSAAVKYSNLASDLQNTSHKASNFFDQGQNTLKSVHNLSQNLCVTSTKVNKILDNTNLANDIKESLNLTNQTMQKVDSIMVKLNDTLKDKDLRKDIINILGKVYFTSKSINQSIGSLGSLAKDKNLRQDVMVLIKESNKTIVNANKLIDNIKLDGDLKSTISEIKQAATDIDQTANRINSILSKRSPLLHLMFGHNKLPKNNSNSQIEVNTNEQQNK